MSKATVVALGNVSTCAYCRALKAITDKPEFTAAMPGAEFVNADKTGDPTLYAKWKKAAKMTGDWPVIAVFDDTGALKGKFVARSGLVKPFTAAGIVAKIKSLCPTCCIEGGCEDGGTDDTPTGGTCDSGCGDGCTCKSCKAQIRFCPACGKELC